MDNSGRQRNKQNGGRTAIVATAAALLAIATAAQADDSVTMAPPIGGSSISAGGAYNTSADSVFNWSEVPVNQQVPLRRAAFDQGGYQLYDTAGETIVVPFTNDNLYVMKFAPSPDGTLYFVNEGSAPVLYVPQGGYLDNATVPGGKWYPFSDEFRPSEPVFLGIAPSWNDYVDMGWYPGMTYYGGYWGYNPFVGDGVFVATPGLVIIIGGSHYYGWHRYHDYWYRHHPPYRITYYNRNVYHWASHPDWSRRTFSGTHQPYLIQRHVDSSGRSTWTHQPIRRNPGTPGTGGTRGFNGAGGTHTFQNGNPGSARRTFRGTEPGSQIPVFRGTPSQGQHGFNGGARGGTHGFNGGSESGQHNFGGNPQNQGGGARRTFRGTQPGGQTPVDRGSQGNGQIPVYRGTPSGGSPSGGRPTFQGVPGGYSQNRPTFQGEQPSSNPTFRGGQPSSNPTFRPSPGPVYGGNRPSGGQVFGGTRPSGGQVFGGTRPNPPASAPRPAPSGGNRPDNGGQHNQDNRQGH
jgi:hypothetical protein